MNPPSLPLSIVILSHATKTGTSAKRVAGMTKAYERGNSTIIFRDVEEIAALADGWDLPGPGLVDVQLWSHDGSYVKDVYDSVRVLGMAAVLPGGPAARPGGGDRAAL